MIGQGPSELYLRGIEQVSTARDALAATGFNPVFESRLTKMFDLHSVRSKNGDYGDIVLFERSNTTIQAKADIIMGLELVAADEAFRPEASVAARGLLAILNQA